jgi:ABC-2 type transport system ATP-binding protein
MSFIVAEEISKSFIGTTALEGFDVEIPHGQIFGLLGPNGAGKTTFIRILNQIVNPDSGSVTIGGNRLCQKDIYRIGYLPEERGLYKKMKVGEQAIYFAALKGMHPAVAKKELLQKFEQLDMSNWWNKRVEELSKGMQQKIQFISTILHKPEILILDEPFSGFDPINAEIIKKEILALQQTGTTIILSTHNMSSVEELCDSIALLHKGHKVLHGSVHDIKQSFKNQTYTIRFSGYFNNIMAALSSSYTILSQEKSGDITEITIRLTEEVASNNILQHFMQTGAIISFNEVLPSMHDIFLSTISKTSQTEYSA